MGCFFMKINKTDKILQIYSNMGTNKVKANRKSSERDEVKLSERAMDYQFAISKLKELPEMRREKVEKLKREIKSGNYNVSGKEIVDKMYERINFDKKI